MKLTDRLWWKEYRAARRKPTKAILKARTEAKRIKANARRILKKARGPSEKERLQRSASQATRRTRETQAGGTFTHLQFIRLCRKYGNKCLGPGPHSGILVPDHVRPVALGGTSNIDNIQPLCFSCNSHKGAREIDYRKDTDNGNSA